MILYSNAFFEMHQDYIVRQFIFSNIFEMAMVYSLQIYVHEFTYNMYIDSINLFLIIDVI